MLQYPIITPIRISDGGVVTVMTLITLIDTCVHFSNRLQERMSGSEANLSNGVWIFNTKQIHRSCGAVPILEKGMPVGKTNNA